MTVLKVGQIWAETDPRSADRRFRIERVGSSHVEVRNLVTGRRTSISRYRLRPTSGKRGYRLLEQPPEATA